MSDVRKVALVTGSGKRRVGWHVADALARRGYDLAVHYHSSHREAAETTQHLSGLGIRAAAYAANLSDEAEVIALVEAVAADFGRIDVLVNCAAVWERKALEEVTANDVRRQFEINTLGTFLMCQRVGLRMVTQESGGSIVNIGDWAEVRPYLGYAAYFPSKGAIPTLTRTFAVELGTRNANIRVNAILPGPVMLPPDLPAAERDEAIEATVVQREGSPNHVAQAVLGFLDNDYVTGTCLPVDGGRTIYARGY